MKKKITAKIFQIIGLADLVLLVISSAFGTLFQWGGSIYTHPLYLSLWAVSILLIFLWPVFIDMDRNRFGRFVSSHAAYILLLSLVVLSFVTTRRAEITLYEGESFSLGERLSEEGIPWKEDSTEFHYLFGDVEGQQITTHYSVISERDNRSGSISVNHPLRLNRVKFFQQGGGLGFRSLSFRVNGATYDFAELDGSPVSLANGQYLFVSPDFYKDQKLHLNWELVDSELINILEQGDYVSDEGTLKTEGFELEILDEDVLAVSVLQVVYFPLAIPLSIMALAFLVKLATSLWGKKK